jgi:mycothiol synthase
MAALGEAQYLPGMPEIDADGFEIGPPPPELMRGALELMFSALAGPQRATMLEVTLAAVERGERSLDGLLAARRQNHLAGAVWSELHAGHTAEIWPPRLADDSPPRLADDLLAKALTCLRWQQVTMVQSLLTLDTGADADHLRRAGFEHACDLLYLVSPAGAFPTSPAAGGLTFEAVDGADLEALVPLIERTYVKTLDCPALNGRRDCHQVVIGYRATCHDDLSHWFIVRHQGETLGCLLLSHDARQANWELIYMGLLPEARGRGWGLEMVRHAQWRVAAQGGERLVLAVDAANQPAITIYAAAGFLAWDRRSVFVKFLSPAAA